MLSQTCSSSGCERNWSTWSLIHTKLRNRLAMKKLHKLVFVHYNMRLRVRNLTYQRENDDFYNPIDLNYIFNDEDILDEWIREGEEPILPPDNLGWLDEGIRDIEEGGSGRDAVDEGDTNMTPTSSNYATTRRSGKDTRPTNKGKKATRIFVSSSDSSSDDDNVADTYGGGGGSSGTNDDDDDDASNHGGDNNEGNKSYGGGTTGDGGDTQLPGGMSWAQGQDNYYATQDTDHGYRPGAMKQRRNLNSSIGDDYSNRRHHHSLGRQDIDDHMQSLGLASHEGYMPYGHHQNSGIESSYAHGSYGYGIPSQLPRSTSTNSAGHYGHRPTHLERSTSTSTGGYYDRVPRRHHDGSSNTTSGSVNFYGYDQSSTSSGREYRGFGYYQHGNQPVQPPQSNYSDYGSSSQSSQPTQSDPYSHLYSYPYGGHYPNLYYSRDNNDDFEPHRRSMWQ